MAKAWHRPVVQENMESIFFVYEIGPTYINKTYDFHIFLDDCASVFAVLFLGVTDDPEYLNLSVTAMFY